MYYLSIIVPFHNSANKCSKLIETLSSIKDKGVELILVDDGSTDDTLKILNKFERSAKVDAKIIFQENKGAGAARNKGIRNASGKYVWIIDSDDNIFLDSIFYLKKKLNDEYDFIDFNHNSKDGISNSMDVSSGTYKENIKAILLDNFGRIWTKIIKRKIITDNNIYYPEQCDYDDNGVIFIYPFFIKTFHKSDIIAYEYNEDLESMTRSDINVRFYDRMYTAEFGLIKGVQLANKIETEKLKNKFTRLYLINTAGAVLTKSPIHEWLIAMRVMRQYRTVAKKHKANYKFSMLDFASLQFKLVFNTLWLFSFILPNQNKYFSKVRLKAWGVGFTM